MRKKVILISVLLILLGLNLNIYDLITTKKKKLEENKNIEIFFKSADINIAEAIENNLYIAVIEIPKINLKKGLVDINSSHNNVNENITILSNSKMPNINNSTLILAAHSGNANISYFNNLNKLKLNDLVYIYYDNIKYEYKIINYYEEEKDGGITIKKNSNDKNIIVLTTCKQITNDRQLTYIGELTSESVY